MFWILLYLLQAYIVGFYYISNRAKEALKLADKHWPEGQEDKRRDVDGSNHFENITLLDCTSPLHTKEDWVHYNRNVHLMWFIFSPLWSDAICVIKFVKFVVSDINPQIALIFEQGLSIKNRKNEYIEENFRLQFQIQRMQEQLDELAKKTS